MHAMRIVSSACSSSGIACMQRTVLSPAIVEHEVVFGPVHFCVPGSALPPSIGVPSELLFSDID